MRNTYKMLQVQTKYSSPAIFCLTLAIFSARKRFSSQVQRFLVMHWMHLVNQVQLPVITHDNCDHVVKIIDLDAVCHIIHIIDAL